MNYTDDYMEIFYTTLPVEDLINAEVKVITIGESKPVAIVPKISIRELGVIAKLKGLDFDIEPFAVPRVPRRTWVVSDFTEDYYRVINRRRLKGTWSVEAMEDINSIYAMDLEEELSKALQEEIDKELLKNLRK